MYVAGLSKEPPLLEYQASNWEISIVTPDWNRSSSPAMTINQFNHHFCYFLNIAFDEYILFPS